MTAVPAQTGLTEAAMETLTGRLALIVMVTGTLVAVEVVIHVALLVIVTVTASPLASVLLV